MTSRLRLLVAAAAVLVTAVGGVALPSPASADPVATAQERVDRLQGLAKETTRRLLEGTQRWEADQARLRAVQLTLGNTRRHVREAEQTAAAGSARVSALARRLYMRPTPDGLQLAFTLGPEDVLGALSAKDAVDRVAGSDAQVVRAAQVARLQLKTQERAAQQLAAEAERLVAGSAKRLRELKDLAGSTARQLQDAQDTLQQARSARDRAAAARARASRARMVFSGGAACTGRSTEGQQNGNLDPASLCPLWQAPGHRLRSDAATAFNALSKHHAATVGGALCVTDSYRSYSEQAALYQRKPGLAAVPGTSNHGWGKAVDLCGGVQDSSSAAYQWMKANAPRFGWIHPEWAEPSGSRPEAWHWEFNG